MVNPERGIAFDVPAEWERMPADWVSYVAEEERHDAPEALMVIDGRLELEVDGQRVQVEAGEMYVIPAGTAHAVRPGSRGTLMLVGLAEDRG